MITIDTGDTVFHRPSRETWSVACVVDDRLSWRGYPEGTAALKDCLLVEKASSTQREKLLAEMAAMGGRDHRQRFAQRAIELQARPAFFAGSHTDPHPRWQAGKYSDRHPRSAEEFDPRNDPPGGAFERSLKRLKLAADYDDPRVPDQMACVLRVDVSRIIGDWIHKNAAWEMWRGERGTEKFQGRVQPWMLSCFGERIAADVTERNHRFLEEALELVQACGCTREEAHRLVDYTFDRPIGEPAQEVGGVMVTLAALCLANALDMHAAGEIELARIWTMVEQIRAKQAAKPKHSPLAEAS